MRDGMNTTKMNSTTEVDGRSTVEIFLSVLFLAIIMFLSAFGNIAVILAIIYDRRLKNEVSNIFVINLAITDLLNSLFVMVMSLIAIVNDTWTLGSTLCDIVCCANYCFIITSMLTLCFISFDRYCAILYPFDYVEKVTKFRILLAIMYTWFQAIVFSVIPGVMQWIDYDYWEAVCAIDWFSDRPNTIYYVVSAFILCFLGPGILLIVNYSRIMREVKSMQQDIQPASISDLQQNIKRDKMGKKNHKIIKSLLVVVMAYFICMTPFSVTKLIKVVVSDQTFVPPRINTAASLIGYCSSAANPFIYAIFRPDFRKAYRNALYKVLRRGSLIEPIETTQ